MLRVSIELRDQLPGVQNRRLTSRRSRYKGTGCLQFPARCQGRPVHTSQPNSTHRTRDYRDGDEVSPFHRPIVVMHQLRPLSNASPRNSDCPACTVSKLGPFIFQQRTSGDCIGMSVLCQQRKSQSRPRYLPLNQRRPDI